MSKRSWRVISSTSSSRGEKIEKERGQPRIAEYSSNIAVAWAEAAAASAVRKEHDSSRVGRHAKGAFECQPADRHRNGAFDLIISVWQYHRCVPLDNCDQLTAAASCGAVPDSIVVFRRERSSFI
jgi:hypothetical protein